VVGHPLNTHIISLGFAEIFGHDLDDFDKPLLIIAERKMMG